MDEDKGHLTSVVDIEIKEAIEKIAEEREWSVSLVIKKILTQAVSDFNEKGKIIGID